MKQGDHVRKYCNGAEFHLNGAVGAVAGFDWRALYSTRRGSTGGATAARLRRKTYTTRPNEMKTAETS